MRELHFLIFFVIPFYSGLTHGQSIFNYGGAKAVGVGYAAVTFSDYSSPQNNIAGIAGAEHFTASAGFSRYYNIDGLNKFNFNLIYPLKNLSLSLSAIREGDLYLNMQRVAVGMANEVGFVKIGIQLNYIQYSADEFGTGRALALDFGGIADLNEKIKIGAHIFNFTQSTIFSDPPEILPVVMRAGISYFPVTKVKMVVEIEKEVSFEPLRKAGIEYQPVNGVFARTGISFDPMKHFFGVGFRKRKLIIDYAFSQHARLGLVHHINIAFNLREK